MGTKSIEEYLNGKYKNVTKLHGYQMEPAITIERMGGNEIWHNRLC